MINIKEYCVNLSLKTIFEIGVGNPNICRTIDMMGDNRFNLNLFEAHPQTYTSLVDTFGHYQNLTINNIALFDRDGEIIFCEDGDSSYIDEVVSPTKHNVPHIAATKNKIIIECKSIKHFDNDNIDVILVDTEGSEWRIIKDMISRPKLIVLETHNYDDHGNGLYSTPGIEQIIEWMQINNYHLIGKDATDSYFEKVI